MPSEYLARVLLVGLGSWRRGPMDVGSESVVPMRVWPTDIDIYGHMNNGRYLTIMDYGRTDLAIRTGMFRQWIANGWSPLLGGSTIRYRRALKPLRRYTLHTRLVYWDDKWMYFEQRFERNDSVYAIALCRGLVRGKQGNVPPAELMRQAGQDPESPEMPGAVRGWVDPDPVP